MNGNSLLRDNKLWCERCDSNARTPTRLDSESSAFDLAGQLSHDRAYVAEAHNSALCSYTLSLKAFSEDEIYPGTSR